MAALRTLVRFCLRYRYAVVLVAAGLCILAFFDVRNTAVRVFPSFEPPVVKVITRVPGLSPRGIELSVTDMLEQGLTGLSGLRATVSRSQPGVSIITLIFRSHTRVALDRKAVAARLSELTPTLPPEAVPHIERLTSMVGVAAEIGVLGTGISPLTVGRLVETRIVPELEATAGVAKVDVYGAATPVIAVEPHVSAMLATGIGWGHLAKAAHQASAVLGLGAVTSPNQRILVEGHGQTLTSAALADSVIGQHDGRPLTMGMVARVVTTAAPRVGAALIGNRPGVVLVVWAQHGAATSAVAARVQRKVRRLRMELRGRHILIRSHAFVPAAFSRVAVANVLRLVLLGAVGILLILALALRDWRMIAVAYMPIIVSVLGTLAALHFSGVPLNTLGLSGLAIALAEIVHDSVADGITIQRRLLQEPGADSVPRKLQVIGDAAVAIRSKAVICALVTSILFVPIVLLPGFPGELFGPVAITYIIAIVTSVAVNLAFSPALAGILLADVGPGRAPPDPPRAVRRLYQWLIQPAKLLMWVEAGIAAVLFAVIAGSIPFLRVGLLPTFSQRALVVHLRTAPGTSLGQTERIVGAYVARLRGLPGVQHVIALVGRGRPSDHSTDVNRAALDVTTASNAPQAIHSMEAAIMRALACPPALDCAVSTFMDERMRRTLPGYTAPLAMSLTGVAGAAIRTEAVRLEREIRRMPSVRKATLDPTLRRRTIIRIRPERSAMAQYGVTSRAVLSTVAAAYPGRRVASVYVRDYREPVELLATRRERGDAMALERTPIRADDGRLVPLELVARVGFRRAVGTIAQKDGERVQRLLVWPRRGYTVPGVRRRIAGLAGARGSAMAPTVSFTGISQVVSRAARAVIVRAAIALMVVVFLLWVLLTEARAVAMLSLGLPVAVSGGIAMIWLFLHGTANFAVLIGLVALFGIALRNGLLLVFYYRTLSPGGESGITVEKARAIAVEMLPVVLVTASVAIMGLLPLAVYGGTAGDEIAGPLAVVIIGGLGTGAILTALALPRMLPRILHVGRMRRREDV